MAKKKAKKHGKADMLLVSSNTRDALKKHGCNVAADALDGLNHWVHWLIDQGAERAHANGRKTVRKHDIFIG